MIGSFSFIEQSDVQTDNTYTASETISDDSRMGE